MVKKILVTGFGPFDIFSFNPSEDVAKVLSDSDDNIFHKTLPIEFGKGRSSLLEALDEIDPELVISFGLNGYIGHIAIEEIAVNIASFEIPDNSGFTTRDDLVSVNGPLAFRTGLPSMRIIDSLRAEGIPARRSYSAGVFICNEVFYTLMEWCQRTGKTGGFIHIPMATEMIADNTRMYRLPHMSMEMMVKAGHLILNNSI